MPEPPLPPALKSKRRYASAYSLSSQAIFAMIDTSGNMTAQAVDLCTTLEGFGATCHDYDATLSQDNFVADMPKIGLMRYLDQQKGNNNAYVRRPPRSEVDPAA